ncbi:hypothetical protein [Bradyrhizobium ivorense]|uniref:hypothetical protein n=1 Tax=Bradyrhizobium ivorense TaxID=2511166 RepID=UPI0010B27E70|nr:hypothetical protein [Bradyrhizobium ivorense]VIO69859.1 hypothetical protein CI41S_21060 [Bradyrhizobium ivorense]
MTPVVSCAEPEHLLQDAMPYGDLTAAVLGIGASGSIKHLFARGPIALAGIEDATAIIELPAVGSSYSRMSATILVVPEHCPFPGAGRLELHRYFMEIEAIGRWRPASTAVRIRSS